MVKKRKEKKITTKQPDRRLPPLMAFLYVSHAGNANSEVCWPRAPGKHLITPGSDSAACVGRGRGTGVGLVELGQIICQILGAVAAEWGVAGIVLLYLKSEGNVTGPC